MRTGAILSGYSARDYSGEKLFKLLAPPKPPESSDYTAGMTKPIGMLGNDQLGDCCFASIGHMVNCWMGASGHKTDVTESEIKRDYLDHTGNRDIGAELRAVLKRFSGQKAIAKHRGAKFVRLDHQNVNEVRLAIHQFGGVYAALVGPSNMLDLRTWATDAPGWRPNNSMAHCVPLLGYGPKGFKVATWNEIIDASLAYYVKYFVEAWAVISPDWWSGKAISPSGLLLTDAFKALKELES